LAKARRGNFLVSSLSIGREDFARQILRKRKEQPVGRTSLERITTQCRVLTLNELLRI
jgi:hypothetical protein